MDDMFLLIIVLLCLRKVYLQKYCYLNKEVAMKRKNIYIISLLCIIICCITIGFFSKERRLSEDEIEALREQYPIRVIEDVTGQYQEGDLLTIAGNMMLKDEKPDLQPGMKMIIPLKENDSKDTRNYFTEIGMYYVTEDGYAISAYDETDLSRTIRSGIKVKTLLKELQELMEEFQE